MNGGNEATQLLRKMINCRSLGIPFSPSMHLPTTLDQPMALLKVRFINSFNDSNFNFPLIIFFRMLKSKQVAENKHVQVVQVCKRQQLRKEWEDHRHSQQFQLNLVTDLETIYGPVQMILLKVTTTTIARRTPTTINRAHRRICLALIVEQQRQQSGVATYAVKWCAMHAACTLNFTESIDHTQCVVTQSTRADDVQRAISRTEEVMKRKLNKRKKRFLSEF